MSLTFRIPHCTSFKCSLVKNLKWAKLCLFLFIFVLLTLQCNWKSVNSVLGIRARGHRMKSGDESTVLRWPPCLQKILKRVFTNFSCHEGTKDSPRHTSCAILVRVLISSNIRISYMKLSRPNMPTNTNGHVKKVSWVQKDFKVFN